ncbi:MAG: formate dehydrogenase accessory sulfurtransferase FdhD [Dehalococcoidales bacterium]
METETEKISILKFSGESSNREDDVVARETPLTIILNDRELVTLLCSPKDLNYLAIGFLSSEGFIENRDEISKIIVDDIRGVARVRTREGKVINDDIIFKRLITSGCGRGTSFYKASDVENRVKIESGLKISGGEIMALVKEFQRRSLLYRSTGGVHSAALCEAGKILVFNEDIGRHNAIDKIFGECLLKGIDTRDRLVVTSGRISSEILLKVASRQIPVIVSKSAPTDLGVKMADDLGITLLGFVRGKRINAYTHDWRITVNG